MSPSNKTTRSHKRAAGLALLVAVVAAVPLAGCGGVPGDGRGTLTVSAATSLRKPFDAYVASLPSGFARFQFGGSDTLAAAIKAGQRPDVFIAASHKQPADLQKAGLTGRPIVIAGNRVVIAVPAGKARVKNLSDLASPGVRIALGSSSVPVGAYADKMLSKLPASQRAAILANVRTREPNAAGVVAKLREGVVDAAITYSTDVAGSRGSLKAIALPAAIAPPVDYVAVVIKGTNLPNAAAAFIQSLRSGAGMKELRAAGFLPPSS
jgi:molybdate transport system substrate-binding protein